MTPKVRKFKLSAESRDRLEASAQGLLPDVVTAVSVALYFNSLVNLQVKPRRIENGFTTSRKFSWPVINSWRNREDDGIIFSRAYEDGGVEVSYLSDQGQMLVGGTLNRYERTLELTDLVGGNPELFERFNQSARDLVATIVDLGGRFPGQNTLQTDED